MTTVLAVAEFTQDMAETLESYFQAYAADGVVTVEVTDRGLWLVNPRYPSRQFLGLARLPAGREGKPLHVG
jgi:hypothetical protein